MYSCTLAVCSVVAAVMLKPIASHCATARDVHVEIADAPPDDDCAAVNVAGADAEILSVTTFGTDGATGGALPAFLLISHVSEPAASTFTTAQPTIVPA